MGCQIQDVVADFDLENDYDGAIELMVLILTDRYANRSRAVLVEAIGARVSRPTQTHDPDLFRVEIMTMMEWGPRAAITSGQVRMDVLVDMVRDPILLRRVFDLLSVSKGDNHV
jgi:hypothetical protein